MRSLLLSLWSYCHVLRDDGLSYRDYLGPHVLAQEIADDLSAALSQIQDILGDLQKRVGAGPA